jgi:hypothetical protein
LALDKIPSHCNYFVRYSLQCCMKIHPNLRYMHIVQNHYNVQNMRNLVEGKTFRGCALLKVLTCIHHSHYNNSRFDK